MSKGRFGIHGGQYIPETLMNAVIELEKAYDFYKNDPDFNRELTALLNEYAGRPSRLYYAEKMTRDLGGAKIYLKREDLNHTGSHKINNVLGQALLAKKMGKTRLIAETGAGQHGVATATATLKDAVSEAMREWTRRIDDTHYCLGSVMGPHPFPTIVRDFQSVISRETKAQLLEKEGRLPDAVVACVGGGSNAMGSFYHFIPDKSVRLIGCEAAGRGYLRDRRHHRHRAGGHLPRHEELLLPGSVRTDRAGVLHLRRTGLPGHRPGARLAPRHGPGGVCAHYG